MEREEILSGLEEALAGKQREEEKGAGVGGLSKEEEEGGDQADKTAQMGAWCLSMFVCECVCVAL